jgi:ElaB/YqjD/DUF883 family membrane-anchored ribosome-binding protein
MTDAELRYLVKVNDRSVKEAQRNLKELNRHLYGVQGAGTRAGRGFDKTTAGARRSSTELSKLRTHVQGATKALKLLGGAAVLGGLYAVGRTMKSSISAASDLNESMNAVKVTFGQAAGQIQAFASTAAKTAGLSMREVNEAVTPLGAMLQNVGYSADQAADSSVTLAKRAADMASVFNTTVPEALQAIQAGLRGEADPLEKFGVGLSAAAVKAKAMELGLADSKGQLDQNAVAQARIALLLEQTSKFQGDFANTSGELANQQRILNAEWENARARIGQGLLPALKLVATAMADWLERPETQKRLQELSRQFGEKLPKALAFAKDAAGKIRDALRRVADVLGGWKNLLATLVGAWAGFKVAGVTAAVAVQFANIAAAAGVAAAWRAALISTGFGALAIAAGLAAGYIITHWEKVKGWFRTFWHYLKQSVKIAAGVMLTQLTSPLRALLELFARLPFGMGKPFQKALDFLKQITTDFIADNVRQWGQAGQAAGEAYAAGISSRISQGAGIDRLFPSGTVGGKNPVTKAGIQVPTSFKATHETAGLPGFPAVDIFGQPGTPVLAPEDGAIVRHSGHGGTTGQIFGWSLYFQGVSGSTYFMTHLVDVAPLGRYKRGAVIGRISPWSGGSPHVHVGVHRGSGVRVERHDGGGTDRPSGAAAPESVSRAQEIKENAQRVAVLVRESRGQIVQALRFARTLPRDMLVEELNRFGQVVKIFRVDEIVKKVKNLRAQLKKATTPEQVEKINSALERFFGLLESGGQKAADKLRELGEQAEEALQRVRDAFEEGFGDVFDRALRVFDAKTDQMAQAIQENFERARAAIDAWRSELTATEALLQRMARDRDAARFAEDMAGAQQDVADAQARLNQLIARGASAKRIAEQEAVVRSAQRSVDDLLYDEKVRALEEQARLERDARDREAEARIAAAEEEARQQELQLRAAREERRQEFARRLTELREQMALGLATTDDFLALLGEFDSDFAVMGSVLGYAFVTAFQQALVQLAADIAAISGTTVKAPTIGTAPKLPTGGRLKVMQHGGIVTSPTMALIGEAGPEAVIPLSQLGGGGVEIVVPVILDGHEIARVTAPYNIRELNRHLNRGGRLAGRG